MGDRIHPARTRQQLHTTSRLAAVVALSCTAVLASGCLALQRAPDGTLSITTISPDAVADKGTTKVADAKAESTESAKLHPENVPAVVGTSFSTGSWRVTVTSVKPHKKMSNGQKPKKGNRLIYVNVKVTNIGTYTDLVVKPTQFWVTDSAGERVKPFKTDLVAFNAQQVRPVQVAMGAHTTFVYEIPKDGTGYVFHFKKRKASPTIYRWQVW